MFVDLVGLPLSLMGSGQAHHTTGCSTGFWGGQLIYQTIGGKMRVLLIIDEAQGSYEHPSLWNDLTKGISTNSGPSVVIFSSYGSGKYELALHSRGCDSRGGRMHPSGGKVSIPPAVHS